MSKQDIKLKYPTKSSDSNILKFNGAMSDILWRLSMLLSDDNESEIYEIVGDIASSLGEMAVAVEQLHAHIANADERELKNK
jgi:hypothetical protein